MRRFVVWFVAGVVASVGLVGLSDSPASAGKCPYTGCVRTTTEISAPAKVVKGSIVPIKVKVSAKSGSANPRGTIAASCSRAGKTKSKVRAYSGHSRYVFFRLGKVGTWTCKVRFSSKGKFRKSSDGTTVKVVRP